MLISWQENLDWVVRKKLKKTKKKEKELKDNRNWKPQVYKLMMKKLGKKSCHKLINKDTKFFQKMKEFRK